MSDAAYGKSRHRPRAKLLVLFAVLLMTGSVLSVRFAAPPTDTPKIAVAPDATTAVNAAYRQGTRVEVASERTATRTTYANPDGSMTAEISSVPQRIKRGATWVDVDTRLAKSTDGAIHPAAAEGGLALSGGGSVAPLAELTRDGKRLALRWPGALPAPKVDGDAATYPAVLPGVDLVMRAERDGYRQQFVVKDANAAKGLARITLRLETSGLEVKTGDAGSLHAFDDAGKEVFSAPPAVMWDGAGARTAVGVELGAQTIALVPDQKFLADKATVYPVVVDPDWHTFGWGTWNTVLSGKPNQAYPRTSGDGTWAQVGVCYTASGGCNGIGTARAYFQYDTGFLGGRHILSASLNTLAVYSPSCGDRWHQLFMATGTIGDGTTWNNAPQGWKVSDVVSPSVYGSACGGYKTVGFPATGAVNAGGISTYFIKASDEGDQYAWRKYSQNDSWLVVNYNTRPDPASELATDPPLKAPCRWCDGKPWVADDSLRFQARLTDPDGSWVKPWWHIYTGSAREERWGVMQASGAYHSTDIDLSQKKDGDTITLWVQPWDAYEDGNLLDSGDWRQGPGPFAVDRTTVDVAPKVTGLLYTEDNRWHGGAGVPGMFTFEANGVPDIDHYAYSWGSGPQTFVDANALGGTATVVTAPDGDGPRDLNVQSFDRAGRPSPVQPFHVYVKPGNGPLAQWSFEGNFKDDANLGWRDATPYRDPAFTPGAVGSGIKLDGTQEVDAPNTVQARESFSVAAWVKIDRTDSAYHNVFSQGGSNTCSFCMQYGPDGKWVFVMPQTDSANPPGWNLARSKQPAVANTWTHLAGSYDDHEHKVRLYVNGVLAEVAPAPSSWQGNDLFRIGNAFPGVIDEVRAYDRRVSDAEVLAMVTGDNVQSGQWRFEDKTGGRAANSVPGAEAATLYNGASFTPDGAVGGGLKLDGQDDYAATSGPMVRTDQSFSVSAWVNPQIASPVDNGFYSAVSQDGNVNSGFLLGYRPLSTGNKWEVYLPSADATTRPADEAVRVDAPAPMNKWTQLVAVYDAPAKLVSIYVDGQFKGSAPRTAGFSADGPFTLGRGKMQGLSGHHWEGLLDEVRAYNRVLGAGEIQAMVSRDDVTQLSWKFDGDAEDDSGRANDGTVKNQGTALTWTAGQANAPDQADLAATLDGVDDYVVAKKGTDTSQSFSLSAWVKLNSAPDGWVSVASQNGDHTSAFWLGYTGKSDNHWAFAMHGPDVDSPTAVRIRSTEAAQPAVWTHLAAVFDRPSNTMSLYVNGLLSTTAPYTGTAWNAKGEFDIGRAKWVSSWTNYWPGAVDDVKLYGRTLFADEVRTQAGRDLSLVHDWRFDEPSGTNAGDAVGSRAAAFSGGVSLVPGRVGNAIHVDGTGALTTTGVDVRTDDSFTVSAWVRMGKPDCDLSQVPECKRVVLSVDGNRASKFRLGYVKDSLDNQLGLWTFEMPESDADSAVVTKAAVSTEPADQDHWVHLVGVYDQPAKKIWLYVNGTRIGDGTVNGRWNAPGAAAIGRGKINGDTAKQNWVGDIDDTRIYTGTLDKDRISALYKSYPPEAANGPATLPAADTGYWSFDENTGTTVADSSGKGHPATMKGGAAWIAGGRKGPSSWFDGTTGYAETAAPAVKTDSSFSVATWVCLTEGRNGDRTIVAQDGTRVSSFMLQYRAADDKWAVQVPLADQDNAATVTLTSALPAVWNDWVHLAMTYDATAHQVRLYLNGVLQSAQSNVTILPSSGPTTFGRAKWNGVNAQFFPRAVDDVRVFGKVLSDGEVVKVREDTYVPSGGRWSYDDGTARDVTWRADDATLTGGTSFTSGVSGKALQLDGSTGSGTAKWLAHNMQDSLTVSSWVKLARGDKVSTVAGQDGDRMSGFVLQYRPELKHWIFGAAQSDTDAAPMVYAESRQQVVTGLWTHVTGVYDFARHQLRVYVDGQLAGTKDNVTLWRATGAFTLGRDKVNGKPADFFPGLLDETNVEMGALEDAVIARRATYPAAQPGQFGRYANGYGEHASGSAARAGYHFETPLGLLAGADQPNTRSLYACAIGLDGFTSADAACEGKTVLGEIGKVYTKQPANLPTVAVYRCSSSSDHFDSRDSACENAGTNEGLLGYTLAYGKLVRYYTDLGYDHLNTTYGAPPGYWIEGPQGVLPMLAQSGTVPLLSCTTGTDQFLSTDSGCEGKTVERALGQIFTSAPPDVASTALYRCKANGESFTTMYADCNGFTFDRLLGYVPSAAPTTPPVFPAAA